MLTAFTPFVNDGGIAERFVEVPTEPGVFQPLMKLPLLVLRIPAIKDGVIGVP